MAAWIDGQTLGGSPIAMFKLHLFSCQARRKRSRHLDMAIGSVREAKTQREC